MSAKPFPASWVTGCSKLIKSILDKLVAAIALLFFSPILLTVAIAIYIRMGRPIFFTQPRPGKDSKIFSLTSAMPMVIFYLTHSALQPSVNFCEKLV